MQLWIKWWEITKQLRPCFSRRRTFLWFALILMGFCSRAEYVGITSIIRSLGMDEFYYDRLLDFFHSNAVKLPKLIQVWFQLVLATGFAHRVNGRIVILGDGVKAPKEGRRMPAVKSLHQDSESNSKPEYIMGHSCQAISILLTSAAHFFATPLVCQIHEGIVESNRDKRTVLDKMIIMIESVGMQVPFYFVADAYYASKKTILPLLAAGNHLISRVKMNATAYLPLIKVNNPRRGRPRLYGDKIKLRDIFKQKENMVSTTILLYGEPTTILYCSLDLIWKPVGKIVRFVFVQTLSGTKAIFMSTDLTLNPFEILNTYSLRYKIEVLFKQALRVLGTLSYHFWMKTMDKIKRKSGNQYLHKKSADYRNSVKRKLSAYHIHMQVGFIAQGILQIISLSSHQLVWKSFGSWLRTIRPNVLPSEQVVMTALRNTLPDFLAGSNSDGIIEKFVLEKLDLSRSEGQNLITRLKTG